MQSNDSIRVRKAAREDAPDIARVLHEAFAEYEPLYTPEGFAATTPEADVIEKRLDEGTTWVALLDGEIVGTVSVAPRGERLYVRSMAVLPSARGRGIGRLLMRQVGGYAAEHRYETLFLSTTPFLDGAIALYESVGFRRTEEGPHDLFGTPLFSMEKMLAARGGEG